MKRVMIKGEKKGMSIKRVLGTILWTLLSNAIQKDFGITLPKKSGNETTKMINEIVGMIEESDHDRT